MLRTLLFTFACFVVVNAAGAAHAAPQEEAPIDTTAEDDSWRQDCPRRTNVRGAFAGPRACRTVAYSALRNCTYEIDVRAASLRYASGRRRHARVATCTQAPIAA